MFIIFLRFSEKRSEAPRLMDGHNNWLRKGFEAGTFVLSGSIKPNAGGMLLAHRISVDDLWALVHQDPFVIERVVDPEIIEVTPGRSVEHLAFLDA